MMEPATPPFRRGTLNNWTVAKSRPQSYRRFPPSQPPQTQPAGQKAKLSDPTREREPREPGWRRKQRSRGARGNNNAKHFRRRTVCVSFLKRDSPFPMASCFARHVGNKSATTTRRASPTSGNLVLIVVNLAGKTSTRVTWQFSYQVPVSYIYDAYTVRNSMCFHFSSYAFNAC